MIPIYIFVCLGLLFTTTQGGAVCGGSSTEQTVVNGTTVTQSSIQDNYNYFTITLPSSGKNAISILVSETGTPTNLLAIYASVGSCPSAGTNDKKSELVDNLNGKNSLHWVATTGGDLTVGIFSTQSSIQYQITITIIPGNTGVLMQPYFPYFAADFNNAVVFYTTQSDPYVFSLYSVTGIVICTSRQVVPTGSNCDISILTNSVDLPYDSCSSALGNKNYISLRSSAAANYPYGAVTVKNYTGAVETPVTVNSGDSLTKSIASGAKQLYSIAATEGTPVGITITSNLTINSLSFYIKNEGCASATNQFWNVTSAITPGLYYIDFAAFQSGVYTIAVYATAATHYNVTFHVNDALSLDDGLVHTGYSQSQDYFKYKVSSTLAGSGTAVKLAITGMGFDVYAMQYQMPSLVKYDYVNTNSTSSATRYLIIDGCGLVTGPVYFYVYHGFTGSEKTVTIQATVQSSTTNSSTLSDHQSSPGYLTAGSSNYYLVPTTEVTMVSYGSTNFSTLSVGHVCPSSNVHDFVVNGTNSVFYYVPVSNNTFYTVHAPTALNYSLNVTFNKNFDNIFSMDDPVNVYSSQAGDWVYFKFLTGTFYEISVTGLGFQVFAGKGYQPNATAYDYADTASSSSATRIISVGGCAVGPSGEWYIGLYHSNYVVGNELVKLSVAQTASKISKLVSGVETQDVVSSGNFRYYSLSSTANSTYQVEIVSNDTVSLYIGAACPSGPGFPTPDWIIGQSTFYFKTHEDLEFLAVYTDKAEVEYSLRVTKITSQVAGSAVDAVGFIYQNDDWMYFSYVANSSFVVTISGYNYEIYGSQGQLPNLTNSDVSDKQGATTTSRDVTITTCKSDVLWYFGVRLTTPSSTYPSFTLSIATIENSEIPVLSSGEMLTGFLDSNQYTYVNLDIQVTGVMSVTLLVTPMDATNDTSDIHIYGAFEACPTPNSNNWLTTYWDAHGVTLNHLATTSGTYVYYISSSFPVNFTIVPSVQNITTSVQIENQLESGTLLNKDDWIYFSFDVYTSGFSVEVVGSHTNFYLKKGSLPTASNYTKYIFGNDNSQNITLALCNLADPNYIQGKWFLGVTAWQSTTANFAVRVYRNGISYQCNARDDCNPTGALSCTTEFDSCVVLASQKNMSKCLCYGPWGTCLQSIGCGQDSGYNYFNFYQGCTFNGCGDKVCNPPSQSLGTHWEPWHMLIIAVTLLSLFL